MKAAGAVLLLLTVLGLGSCAKPPEAEIEAFREDYPEEYRELVDPELEAQLRKFALFRSYTRTKEIMVRVESGVEVAPAEEDLGWRTVKTHDMPGGVTCYTYTDAISCVQRK